MLGSNKQVKKSKEPLYPEDTPSKFNESFERIKNLYKSLEIDDREKLGELDEIEQEEIYIQTLKEQREKMEILKREYNRKDQYISDLERENYDLKRNLDHLVQDRKTNEELKNRYEEMLREFKTMKMKKEAAENEYEKIKQENFSVRQVVDRFKEENSKLYSKLQDKDNELEKIKINTNQVNQNQSNQIQMLKSQELKMKEMNFSLKSEIGRLEDMVLNLESVKDKNIALDMELKKTNQLMSQEKLKNDKKEKELKQEIARLQQELSETNIDLNKYIHYYEESQEEKERIKYMRNNYEDKIQQTLSKSDQDEKKIFKLKEEITGLKSDYQKSVEFRNDLSEEHKRLFDRVKETEKELSRLKSENIDLKTSLHKIMEKEENDRKYRLEIEKVKKEMNSIKQQEVKKIHDAFSELNIPIPSTSYHQPSSTKSEKFSVRYLDDSKRNENSLRDNN